jgi:hypothetical protein
MSATTSLRAVYGALGTTYCRVAEVPAASGVTGAAAPVACPAGASTSTSSSPSQAAPAPEEASSAGAQQRPNAELDDVRDLLLREVQDRLDSQRSIQEGFEQQRHLVAQLTSRCDRALAELKEELGVEFAKCILRVEGLDRAVAADCEARCNMEKSHNDEMQELRKLVSSGMESLKATTPERQSGKESPSREALIDGVVKTNSLDGAQEEYLDLEAFDHTLIARLQELRLECASDANQIAAQVSGLDAKLTEEWTGLRGWVDAAVVAVVNRISSLECTLQSEVVERTARMQEVRDEAAGYSEQLQSLQLEMEQISLKVGRNTTSLATVSGPSLATVAGSCGGPVGSSNTAGAVGSCGSGGQVYTPRNHASSGMPGPAAIGNSAETDPAFNGRMQQVDKRMTLSSCSLQGSGAGSMTFRSQPPGPMVVNRVPSFVGCPPGQPAGLPGGQPARLAFPQNLPVVLTPIPLGGTVDGKRHYSGPPSWGNQVLHGRPGP